MNQNHLFCALACTSLLSGACMSRKYHEPSGVSALEGCDGSRWQRDWQRDPPIVVRRGFTGKLFVLGDVHGTLPPVRELLDRAQLARGTPDRPEWLGGDSILVVTGDVIDKGPDSLGVMEFVMRLEGEAARAGGAVVTLMGNHEAAFLNDPLNSKAREFVDELNQRHLNLCRDVYSADSRIGQWLRRRPMAAVINGMYLSHTGYTYQKDLQKMDEHFREMVDLGKWSKKFACGDKGEGPEKQGFFNARVWWGRGGSVFFDQLNLLGVRQIVFGHDPGAFESKGEVRGFLGGVENSALILVDVGLWEGASRGEMLRCSAWSSRNGACTELETLRNPVSPNQPDSGFRHLPIQRAEPPKSRPDDPAGEC